MYSNSLAAELEWEHPKVLVQGRLRGFAAGLTQVEAHSMAPGVDRLSLGEELESADLALQLVVLELADLVHRSVVPDLE